MSTAHIKTGARTSQTPVSRAPPQSSRASASQYDRWPASDHRQSTATSGVRRMSHPSSNTVNTAAPDNDRRRSTIAFAGPSLAPSDSISRTEGRPPRMTKTYSVSTSRTDGSSTARPAAVSRTSSLSGTAWSGSAVPLTETNLEALNEAEPAPTSKPPELRRLGSHTAARSLRRDSRRYSTAVSDEPPAEGKIVNQGSRHGSRRYSAATAERQPGTGSHGTSYASRSDWRQRSVTTNNAPAWRAGPAATASCRQRSTAMMDEREDDSLRSSLMSPRNTATSYSQRRTTAPSSFPSSSGGGPRMAPRTRPPTANPSYKHQDDMSASSMTATQSTHVRGSTKPRNVAAGVAVGAAGQTNAKSLSSSTAADEDGTVEASRASTNFQASQPSRVTAPASGTGLVRSVNRSVAPNTASTSAVQQTDAHSSSSQHRSDLVAAAPMSPGEPTEASSASSPTSAAVPFLPEWERRVCIREYLRPSDGVLIRDREYSMRRIHAPQAFARATAAAR
ncbi:hypothetical protein LTR37_018476 [Vermiconidia calcicola]|uniref:Uncharacterized protein n=1 Tax=Vermiconidia calcicola TaxID=1690605 RepID=A0ACC3MGX0_9PEZI|nr:hypothetical protein LTR37_018476 [Vermiconidia calcicola]